MNPSRPGDVPPPWTCRLRAVVRLGVARWHVTALAAVAYAETPVGPYGEALLAEVRPPLRVVVPWIVVDSPASCTAGRAHWALPKELATVALDLDRLRAAVHSPGSRAGGLELRARAFGPRLPVRSAGSLVQPDRGPAPLRFRGHVRAAVVHVDGGPAPGAGPGGLLDGVLRLAAPQER